MNYRTKLLLVLLFFLLAAVHSGETKKLDNQVGLDEPIELDIFRKAFPDISFTASYDKDLNDWQIKVTFLLNSKKSGIFYWCDGRLLPKEQLSNKSKYLPLLEDYAFGGELQSPSTYTQAQIEEYRLAGLTSTRTTTPFPAVFILDFIYSSSSRKSIEQNLTKTKFLGFSVTVNDRLIKALSVVEKRISELSKTNKDVANFLKEKVDHLEGYNWRDIRDADRKSMHSMGIAIDFLPPKLNRHIYWRWTKDQKGEKWMLTPLSSRWMPPYEVINIFEEEGFVWGGKWLIWDNMHFEYRPEIIEYYKTRN
ncbi:MAG: M15 family metallopeptidase [Treponemataceae bacterium]|nr:M15 family metallopeptidase [Treponemataceae bacterium]